MAGAAVAVILAAGQAKRMQSRLSKALQLVAGRPILAWLLDACAAAGFSVVVLVLAPSSDDIRAWLATQNYGLKIEVAVQHEAKGTGDAVKAALPVLASYADAELVILPGDMPNLSAETLRELLRREPLSALHCVTMEPRDAAAYGRIVRRANGELARIVEFKDCLPEELEIREVNAGIYRLSTSLLEELIPLIQNQNAAQEYYLTDMVALAQARGQAVWPYLLDRPEELMGVNTPEELAAASAAKLAVLQEGRDV